jgi:putative ABC transport system permease protein
MTSQYFKLICRDLLKRKSYSIINISGIALGFTVCILAVLYVYTESSFDKYIPNSGNKYRLLWGYAGNKYAILPYPFQEKLEPQLPQGSQICQVTTLGSQYLSYKQRDYKFEHTVFSDSNFLSMFGGNLFQGDTAKVLDAPFQVLLSERTAQKIFGNVNPVNQTIGFWSKELTVTGVFRNLPETSHLGVDMIISNSSYKILSPSMLTSWSNKSYNFYLSLPSNTNLTQLQNKMKSIYLDSDPLFRSISQADKSTQAGKSAFGFELEPITDIHLKSGHILWDIGKNKGDMSMVIAFAVIGLLILLMSVFNYINLSTAYFQTKNKFSGVQKVLGANAGNLSLYIFMQTSVLVVGGFLFSLLLIYLLLPYFNLIVARQIPYSLLLTPGVAGLVCMVILLMIFLSGLYPAIRFSGENPVLALKRKMHDTNSNAPFSLRKLLVISQFIISMTLMSGILVMGRQIRMMSTEKLGFNTEQLIEIDFGNNKQQYQLFKDQLETLPCVAAVSTASNTPAEYINNENPFRLSRETEDKNKEGSSVIGVAPNYFKVMNINILEGEPFSQSMEKQDVAILSKTAAELLGLSKSVGEKVHLNMNMKDYAIIGVVEDVQYRTLREKPKPVVYLPNFNNYRKTVIRLGKGNHVETIASIRKIWQSMFTNIPFDFHFFDTKLQANYAYETGMMHLLNILVLVSLLISSLGIFGLIMEISVQRTKEIGVRKVNGAKISEIVTMLNKDFVKWVAIAFVIATPIAWYTMHKWLENFAYKTSLSWWIFAMAGLLALGIALLTVSWQSWKAATRNPVEALRYE